MFSDIVYLVLYADVSPSFIISQNKIQQCSYYAQSVNSHQRYEHLHLFGAQCALSASKNVLIGSE